MTTSHRENSSLFKNLVPHLTGDVILPEDKDYHQACQIWNGKVDKHPAAIVRCANAQDVVSTVQWTRSHGL
ncbi:MAG TPA: FAD-linked oxidase, partial [Ktedonobacteraceae bacterium]